MIDRCTTVKGLSQRVSEFKKYICKYVHCKECAVWSGWVLLVSTAWTWANNQKGLTDNRTIHCSYCTCIIIYIFLYFGPFFSRDRQEIRGRGEDMQKRPRPESNPERRVGAWYTYGTSYLVSRWDTPTEVIWIHFVNTYCNCAFKWFLYVKCGHTFL